jgi:archaellum component FlaG (FlaF/FlaG flagellin family)
MENFAITLVCIALLLIGAVSISMSSLNAMNAVSDALRDGEELARDAANTSILCENSSATDRGETVTMYVQNTGNTSLHDFAAWDLIIRLQDGGTAWIPYSAATPGWQTGGFFFPGPSGNLRAQYS